MLFVCSSFSLIKEGPRDLFCSSLAFAIEDSRGRVYSLFALHSLLLKKVPGICFALRLLLPKKIPGAVFALCLLFVFSC